MRLFLAQFIIRSFANIHFRGKYRLLHFLVPKNIVIEDILFGYKIKLDLSDWIQRNIYLRASYRDDTLIIKNILKSGMTFVDIGANIGYFSILASSIVGDEGLVLAFEPNKKLYSKLMETIKINSIKNIKLYNSALGDSEGETFLYTNHEDKNNSTSTLVNMGQKEKFKIEINTLDNILEKLNINQVDYMKVDVDGYEPNILRGAKNALGLKKIKNMQLEFGSYQLKVNDYSSKKLYDMIIGFDYRDIKSESYPPEHIITDRFFTIDDKRL